MERFFGSKEGKFKKRFYRGIFSLRFQIYSLISLLPSRHNPYLWVTQPINEELVLEFDKNEKKNI